MLIVYWVLYFIESFFLYTMRAFLFFFSSFRENFRLYDINAKQIVIEFYSLTLIFKLCLRRNTKIVLRLTCRL